VPAFVKASFLLCVCAWIISNFVCCPPDVVQSYRNFLDDAPQLLDGIPPAWSAPRRRVSYASGALWRGVRIICVSRREEGRSLSACDSVVHRCSSQGGGMELPRRMDSSLGLHEPSRKPLEEYFTSAWARSPSCPSLDSQEQGLTVYFVAPNDRISKCHSLLL
jgi:hypothetical protein